MTIASGRAMAPAAGDQVHVGGSWLELRRQLEEVATRVLLPGHRARVRAALPFGRCGVTVRLESGTPEALARGEADPYRPAAVLDPEPEGADFCARLLFPESDPELEPIPSLLAGSDAMSNAIPVLRGRRVAAATLRAYRPLRRAQIELELADQATTWFAKVERPSRAVTLVPRRAALARVLAEVVAGELRLPPPVAEHPQVGVAIAASAPGISLSACIADDGGRAALARAGRALAGLEHALEVTPELAELFPVHRFNDSLADLGRFAALLRRLEEEAAAASVGSGLDRLRSLGPDSGRRAILHRDLHDQQVVVGEHVTLLDMDQASIGDPALDLGNLLAHLCLRSLQGRLGSSCAGQRDALIESRGVPWTGSWREAVLSWEAAALLRLAAVYALRPRWSHLGLELGSAAHELLDSLGARKAT